MLFNKNNNGTEEVAVIATWTANHRYEHIYPALLLAKRKVLKIIDKATYQKALDHYKSDDFQSPSSSEEQAILDELVLKFRYVLLNFAYSKNLSKDTVLWDNSGINVSWTDNFRPAQQETLVNLGDSLDRDGYEFLDLLIEFLKDYQNIFSDFANSIESQRLSDLFINDAEDFSYYFNINGSVSYFFGILDVIRRVQRTHIHSALGTDYYAKVLDYQRKRLKLEGCDEVDLFEDLPIAPSGGDIVLVNSEKRYYLFSGDWSLYAEDMRELLVLIKPALVDYTIYVKFISDFSNLQGDRKQLEVLQTNSNFLEAKAKAASAHIVKYISDLEPVIIDEDTIPVTEGYCVTKNSFMM